MKRELKGFVCGVISTALAAGGAAFAAGQWKTIDVLENDITVMVDGKQVTEDNFVYNDRTYLPLRAVAEAVGKPVDYDEATNTAYIGSKTVPTPTAAPKPTSAPEPTATKDPNKLSDDEYNKLKAELDREYNNTVDQIDDALEESLDSWESQKRLYDTSSLEQELTELEKKRDQYAGAVTSEGKRKYESILSDIDRVQSRIERYEGNLREIENEQNKLEQQAKKDKQEAKATYNKLLAELQAQR